MIMIYLEQVTFNDKKRSNVTNQKFRSQRVNVEGVSLFCNVKMGDIGPAALIKGYVP